MKKMSEVVQMTSDCTVTVQNSWEGKCIKTGLQTL